LIVETRRWSTLEPSARFVVPQGRVAEQIAGYSDRCDAGLIIVGARGDSKSIDSSVHAGI
jgi:hypothetical protein